ncbi:MAG: transaldolase [Candidatus Ancillula sp.]|jgi:transaldolase|nr:transaldolase [Candidatus Ancillula sp.]
MAQNVNTQRVSEGGVSIWLDDLSRDRLNSGSLEKLIQEKTVVGVTTNPAIFQKAIQGKGAYDEQIAELVKSNPNVSVDEVVTELTTTDVRNATDIFRDVYEASDFVDGRVSIEVDPRLAYDGATTTVQAEQLWEKLDRPNGMIKIPATVESLPAITATLAKGISVNVTMIFSKERYLQVIDAYISGIEQAKNNGHDLKKIASVASFFVSRVDTAIDKQLDEIGTPEALELRGKSALANARVAFAAYEEAFSNDPRWSELEKLGAKKQRPLWASTGVKNPNYPGTLYVDGLVGPNVVNTMPESTLDAVAQGPVEGKDVLSGKGAESQAILDAVEAQGISVSGVLQKLEDDGLAAFVDSWTALLADIQSNIDSKK